MGYWVWLGEERGMGKAYLEGFESWVREPDRQDQGISVAAHALAFFLNHAALHAEAEPLYRRALIIDEQSLGKDHPSVATDLNNLAGLLQDTNRLGEAEPLMRRHVAIFLDFTRRTNHNHPHLNAAINNYAYVLMQMGLSQEQANARINELCSEYGLQFGEG